MVGWRVLRKAELWMTQRVDRSTARVPEGFMQELKIEIGIGEEHRNNLKIFPYISVIFFGLSLTPKSPMYRPVKDTSNT